LFDAHGWGVGYNAGLLLEPNATTRLGFTYRSGVDHKLTGSLDFDSADVLGLPSGPATATGLNLPAEAAVSFTHDWTPQWTGSFELQYDMWGSFKQVTVESQAPPLGEAEFYRNVWMLSAGAIYHLGQQFALRGGFGWDQSPVTDKFRTVSIPDADRLMLGVGAGYTVAPGAVVDLGYAHYFGLTNTPITGSANALDPFTHAVVLTGNFHNSLDYLALSFRYAL
jgi:long-chain fatty acid transport protein